MREVVYKNITGMDPRKREVSIEETYDDSASTIQKMWVSKYFLKDVEVSDDEEELKRWIEDDQENGVPRRCHIIRHVDSRTGENKVVFKVIGEFYFIEGSAAYKIFYVNKLRIILSE